MIQFLNEIWSYRELLSQLVKREIKARYKQSVLGYAWVLLVPIAKLVVMTIVFSFFFRVDTGIPYPIFLFAALVPWTLTASAITAATSSLMANSSLITKIKLPREVFPLSAVIVKIIDFFLSVLVFAVLMVIFHATVYPTLIWVPLILVVQILLILGISFFLSATNVFFRDVENILEVFLMLWMYLTPVVYPPEFIPERFTTLFNLNPMMGITNAYRNVILHGVNPPNSFGYAALISIVLFISGYLYFKQRAKYFADVI